MSNLGDLAKYVVSKLIKNPDKIKIEEERKDRVVRIWVYVLPEDVGRVVGKKGRTINAIRTLLKAASVKARVRVEFDVKELPQDA